MTDQKDSANSPPLHGRILKGVGGDYQVLLDTGEEITAKPRGILRKERSAPYPGDIVDLSPPDAKTTQYSIDHVHDRKSFLIRPTIANLDLMIITCSVSAPKPDCFLLDKMVILCKKAGITPVLCITKSDMDHLEADTLLQQYSQAEIPIFIVGDSEEFQSGLEEMKKMIKGKTVSFSGQSGVGKSTLLNKILGQDFMSIGKVSDRIGKGKHTTRHSQIFAYKDGFLADTPGFHSLELDELEVTGQDVLLGFPEIARFDGKCRFADCRHLGEMGCAIGEDDLDPDRLSRYRQFRTQMDKIQPYEMKKNRNGVK